MLYLEVKSILQVCCIDQRETMIRAVHLLVGILLTCVFPEVTGVLHGATKDDLDRLFTKYEIVSPAVVSPSGQFISHHIKRAEILSLHHQQPQRYRRSLADLASPPENNGWMRSGIDVSNDMLYDDNNNPRGDKGSDLIMKSTIANNSMPSIIPMPPVLIHFDIPVFGSNIRLRLQSKRRLVASGAKSVVFTADNNRIETAIQSNCAYYGKIRHQPKSKVALTTCNGLAGLIDVGDEEYFIEPIEEHLDAATPQRHVMYKRSAVTQSDNLGKRMDAETTFHRFDQESDGNYESLRRSVEDAIRQTEDIAQKRRRRSGDTRYNMEVLLTADSEVVRFHGAEHVENYLLTLINIVDEIYHDSSLGENINIVLTKLYQLNEEKSNELIVDENPAGSLKNVCKWGHDMVRDDEKMHDYAIFLTRKHFGPAGYAHVTGMCHALRSCSLNYEDGFSSAFVVAHETGHVLGMEHDGEENKCGDETNMGSLMAPLVQAAFNRYHWSRCSQKELKRNLRNFNCLLDHPDTPDWGTSPIYPGVTYSMDDQCRYDFGQGYRKCTAFRNLDMCKTLWCSHHENPLFCKTKKGPPLDGTECGDSMWCFKGHCVWRDERQEAIDGSWGAWSAYSECSRSCGTGVMYRSRLCDQPIPEHGGNDCIGQNVDYDLCNKRPCPRGRDFRADQCMYRNNEVEFKNQRHKWLPYEPLDASLKCELFCVSKKTYDVVTMGDFVADGTRCSYNDPHGICISGECVKVGCDMVIDSNVREDNCGVCGGDGRQCRNIQGRINKKTSRKLNNYMKIYKIPEGSRHIAISEVSSEDNSNLLALKDRAGKRYFLNAKTRLIEEGETPTHFVNSGTMWTYDSQEGVESITASGPISSDVTLMILVQNRGVKVKIEYSYIVHVNSLPRSRDDYRWAIRRRSPCSVRCGEGYRRIKYGCRSGSVEKWVGKRNCPGQQPRPEKKICVVECAISTRWISGDWSSCSKSCGADGVQERIIRCHQVDSGGRTQPISDNRCVAAEKPLSEQTCRPTPCAAQWRVGPWSECSTTCGKGVKRRQVLCKVPGRARSSSGVTCSGEKPFETDSCQGPCETESCVGDQSVFCQPQDSRCAIPSYRNTCCRSCQNYNGQDIVARKPAIDRIVDVAFYATSNISDSTDDISQSLINNDAEDDAKQILMTTESTEDTPDIVPKVMHEKNHLTVNDTILILSQDDANITRIDIDDTDNGSEDANYYDDEMMDEYLDVDNGNREYVLTLPPRNNPSEEILPDIDVEMEKMLPNMRGSSETLSISQGSVEHSRRKRFVDSLIVKRTGFSKCEVNTCGVGTRRSFVGCWNDIELKKKNSSLCSYKVIETVCIMPCFVIPKPTISISQNKVLNRSSLECREISNLGFRRRANRHKCRGLKPV